MLHNHFIKSCKKWFLFCKKTGCYLCDAALDCTIIKACALIQEITLSCFIIARICVANYRAIQEPNVIRSFLAFSLFFIFFPILVSANPIKNYDGFSLELANNKQIKMADIYVFPHKFSDVKRLVKTIGFNAELKVLRQDRFGVDIAYIYYADKFLQAELIKKNYAVYYPYGEGDQRCNLINQEKIKPFDAIKDKAKLDNYKNMTLVKGRIDNVKITNETIWLNFEEDWQKDVTLSIPKWVRHKFKISDIKNLEGKEVSVRGFLKALNGPMITLYDPLQLIVFGEC